MNGLFDNPLGTLLRATVATAIAGLVAAVALRRFDVRSPSLHRFVAVLVLLQGWIVAPLTIALPLLEPTPAPKVSVRDDTLLASDAGRGVTPAVAKSSRPAVEPSPSHSASTSRSLDLRSLLVPVWAIGLALAVGLHLIAYMVFVATTKTRLAHGDDAVAWQATLRRAKAPSPVPLHLTDAIGPMLCLFPRGYRVLFPASLWTSLDDDERDAVARHELSHWRRGDVWKAWLARLLAAPQWFNPAAWWAVSRFDEAGEWLCDADVAGGSRDAKNSYLKTLLRLVEHHVRGESLLASSAVGRRAHAHPLLTRVRRLTSPEPVEDTLMKRTVLTLGALALAACGWTHLELVARAADPPASVAAIKTEIESLDRKIADVKKEAERMKSVAETIKANVESTAAELKRLRENPAEISEELKRRAKLVETKQEADQLAALDDLDKLLQNEKLLALGQIARATEHESVRRKCLSAACEMGEQGIPAISAAYESLNTADKKFLVEKLVAKPADHVVMLLALMTKEADDELVASIVGSQLEPSRKIALYALVADSRKDDTAFATAVLDWAEKLEGDEGLLVLYATAKHGQDAEAARAVRVAAKRKDKGLPVIAAGFQNKKIESRKAAVKAGKALGGEAGKFIVDTALAESDADLKAAAEEAVKD